MQGSMRRLILLFCGCLWLAAGAVQAQDSPGSARPENAAAGPPPGFVAPALPKPDDTNAERAKSQPGNNAPFWRAVHDSGREAGYSSLPGAEKGILIQRTTQYPGSRLTTAGEAWRQVRNHWLLPYGGALLVIVVVAIALFYWRRGPIGGDERHTGRLIERFTYFERAAHWTNAIAFVTLAISGLVMAFGKFILLPVIGGTLFGALTYVLKTLHNFVGPLFAVSLVVVFLTFVRDNFPRREDATWLRHFGGMLSGHEVPSHRFNAGEKIVFWCGVLLLGALVVASGLVMNQLVPGIAYPRSTMQMAHMVHNASAVLMLCLFAGHIYLGTVGMRGAYAAMRKGWVGDAWAREHHAYWYEDVRSGKVPVQRSGAASTAPAAAETPVGASGPAG
jgi:formate dehydrogenase subunit gamma